ncbi:MAG: cupin domain-containing protein [Pigmentiphaga sp.]|nr:cupin domain-containing protein [Pigmentiphaga sp.]
MENISQESAERRRLLNEDLARFSCRVHQAEDPPFFTREPRPDMKSVHWRWKDLEPLLRRIGEEVDLAASGPRRTLRLHNPGLKAGTTHTFWASIQVILPGEEATAHRHTASALRFIMQGSGAWTTVDGECYPMNEGDLVLTPTWAWHDHVHKGDAPMIWLDVLDINLMKSMEATFFEPYPTPMQAIGPLPDRSWRQFGSGLMRPPSPSASATNPLLAYPFSMAEPALRAAEGLPSDPCDDVILEYQNPTDGSPAMRTLGQRLQRLRAGFEGRRRRHTGSKLYYVVDGEGTTTVEGECFDWSKGDFFVIAPWAWHRHQNTSASDALLWQVNDLPAHQLLQYYKEEIE